MPGLDDLATQRNELLKAEVAALLSMIGRLDERFLQERSAGHKGNASYNHEWLSLNPTDQGATAFRATPSRVAGKKTEDQKAADRLVKLTQGTGAFTHPNFLHSTRVRLMGESWALADLISATAHGLIDEHPVWKARIGSCLPPNNQGMRLPILLRAAHGSASRAKQGGFAEVAKPPRRDIRVATVFGQLREVAPTKFDPQDLFETGQRYAGSMLGANRLAFLNAAERALRRGVQDTQYPRNDGSLWDYGRSTAAFLKPILAASILSGAPANPGSLKFRLLSIRFDGWGFFGSSHRLPDLLARRRLLTCAVDAARDLLEWRYPIANEIYRDENGSLFLFPDVELELLRDEQDKDLKVLLTAAMQRASIEAGSELSLAHEIEIIPELGPPVPSDALDFAAVLDAVPVTSPNPENVRTWWHGEPAPICTVCGLRPHGPGRKAAGRSVCDTCERRREDRSLRWAGVRAAGAQGEFTEVVDVPEQQNTIWVDEAADENGRLALLVAALPLRDWITGALIKETGRPVSFARIEGAIDTSAALWRSCEQQIREMVANEAGPDSSRLRTTLWPAAPLTCRLGPGHVYSAGSAEPAPQFVYVPAAGSQSEHLVSAFNLRELAIRMGAENRDAATQSKALEYLKIRGCFGPRISLYDPPDGNAPGRARTGSRVSEAAVNTDLTQTSSYCPYVGILLEPHVYMAIVPGNRALDAASSIAAAYTGEMGRVRDLLPLRLGIAFFERHTPMAPVLAAGRKLVSSALEGATWQRGWTVEQPGFPSAPLTFSSTGAQLGNAPGGKVAWDFPPDSALIERYPVAKMPLEKLQPGNCHTVRLSTFDYVYLDNAGRRFDVAYDGCGRRLGDPRRPYLLEELSTIQRLWEILGNLKTSQIHAVISLIEDRRDEWRNPPAGDRVFSRFVEHTFAGANWEPLSWEDFGIDDRDLIMRAGVTGALADTADLFLRALRARHGERSGSEPEAVATAAD